MLQFCLWVVPMTVFFHPLLLEKIAGRYKDANSRVDVKIFEGKSHLICVEPAWEAVADYALNSYENLWPSSQCSRLQKCLLKPCLRRRNQPEHQPLYKRFLR